MTPIKGKRWLGTKPTTCNLCDCELSNEEYFVDGRIRYAGRSTWAIICPDCHREFGCGFGTGRGQKYDTKPPYNKLKTGRKDFGNGN
jgi:hypothetical protein